MKNNISKLLIVFTLVLMLMPCVLYAQFEPTITIDDASTGETPQLVPEGNLDAVITPTADATTGFDLLRYVYTWNNSITPLSDNDLGDGDTSVPQAATIVISTDADDQFGNSEGLFWYLHVKTVYSTLPAAPGIALSTDTVWGPYAFDNVPPSATISLDETIEGQTATTTSVSPVAIAVTGNYEDIVLVWVNTSAQFNTAIPYDFSDSARTTLTYTVDGTGSKTLYAWFEDELENISESDDLTFDVIAGKSMEPAGTMNLEVDATQTFAISGGGAETFDWTIVDSVTGLVSTAATFVGNSSGVATVTITGAIEDEAVKVEAVSTVDAVVYESDIITIVKKSQSFCLDVDGDGVVSAWTDGFLIFRYLAGTFPGDYLISGAVGENASRSTTTDITTYLSAAETDSSLDVDGDGVVSAWTDGFLVFRYLAGTFPGDYLISGAVGENASRSTTTDITAYLDVAKCGL